MLYKKTVTSFFTRFSKYLMFRFPHESSFRSIVFLMFTKFIYKLFIVVHVSKFRTCKKGNIVTKPKGSLNCRFVYIDNSTFI